MKGVHWCPLKEPFVETYIPLYFVSEFLKKNNTLRLIDFYSLLGQRVYHLGCDLSNCWWIYFGNDHLNHLEKVKEAKEKTRTEVVMEK